MSSSDGVCTIVFNGEIYNHAAVRSNLSEIIWRSGSDTETLLEAWVRMGTKVLGQVRGMFAFAVYDARDESLVLVRDRLGIKPLYYSRSDIGISFASEVRALNGAELNLDSHALASYLATGHLPSRGHLGENIEILPPGHWLRVARDGVAKLQRWWCGPEKNLTTRIKSRRDAQRVIRHRVEDAVAEHLLADVPVASFLSGGIDSSIISLIATKKHSDPLRTFTIGFPQRGFDERPTARLMAERIGARHTEIEVAPNDCLDWIIEAVRAMDLPSVDAINSFIVSKAVRREGLKVALSGLGGDELFGGYPSFRDVPRLAWLRFLPKTVAKSFVRMLPGNVREKLEGVESFDAFSLALARRRWWSAGALCEALDGDAQWPREVCPPGDTFAAVSWAELLGYMEPMLLRDSDQMSMAVGLELRVPFLDHRLVELALSLPSYFKRGRPAKRLLIEAFENDLPAEVWKHPKQGFALPMDEWMRGALREFCKEGVDSVTTVLRPTFVRRVVDCFERKQMHWTRLWQIVVLGHYVSRGKSQ